MNQGRLQFCHNETWGEMCAIDWDNHDASVVCKQLGYECNSKLKEICHVVVYVVPSFDLSRWIQQYNNLA